MREPPPKEIPLPGGIRPGESLWSVVHRLIWLYQPGIDELIDLFNIHRQNWPDLLIGGVRHSSWEAAKSRFLIPFVGMSKRQLEAGLLPRYLVSPEQLTFCRSCASRGYHSVLFQLPGLKDCPIHKERLRKCCPHCGSRISTLLGPWAVMHPYACSTCGSPLVSSRLAFFRGDAPQRGNDGFRRIGHWLQRLTQEVLAWGDLRTAYRSHVVLDTMENDRALLALTASCAMRVPPDLALLPHIWQRRASFFFPFATQEHAAAAIHGSAYAGKEASVQIYRVYLKSLRQRYLSHAFLQAIHCKQAGGLWSPDLFRRFPFEVAIAYAVLLLRLRCEMWPSLDPLRKDPDYYLVYNQVRSRDQWRGYTLLSPRSSSDRPEDGVRTSLDGIQDPLRAWVVKHWQLVEYRCLFAEALLFAKEQLGRGLFELAPNLEGRLIPDFFALVRDDAQSAYRLDFWGRPHGDEAAYREWGRAAEDKVAYYRELVEGLR